MLSYKTDIERHIVESAARILAISNLKPEIVSREELEIWVHNNLKTITGRDEILVMLTKVVDEPNKILTKQHIKNTIRLIKMKPVETYNDVDVTEDNANFFKTERGMHVVQRLATLHNTVMAYHDYEKYGKESLTACLKKIYPKATVNAYSVEKEDFEERITVYEQKTLNKSGPKETLETTVKSTWTYIPVLPIVVLETGE